MQRREFITLLGGAAAVGWPLVARAQQPIGQTGKMARLGMLMPGSSAHSETILEPFYRGLRDLGYIEGKNIVFERRYADGDVERSDLKSGRSASCADHFSL
jgi:putative tryptophan/tyrosine transport system substrate-binding protein